MSASVTKSKINKKKSEKKGFSFRRFDIRHPFVIPVIGIAVSIVFSLLLFVTVGGETVGANDAHLVRLYVDNEEQIIPSRAKTVRELVNKMGVQLHEADLVEPSLEAEISEDNFRINVFRARPVTIIDNEGISSTFLSAQRAPRLVAEAAGVKLFPEDKVETHLVSSEERILGEKFVIDRAVPVTINLYGTIIEVRTHSDSLDNLLKEKNIIPNQGDTITSSTDKAVKNGTTIVIARSGTKIITEEQVIESPVEKQEDPALTLGATRVIDPGVPGKRIVTYEITLTNDKETSRKKIQEVIVTPPTIKKVAVGKKAPVVAGNKAEIMTAAGIPASEFYAADFIISKESGWRVNALNAKGCAGLGQACPGSKLAAKCPSWQSDPVCQMQFFNGYAVGRYGSWTNAYNRWQIQRWW